MATIDSIRQRFPAKQRKLWEVDRILIAEPAGERMRFAIDLRAAYSAANRKMGAGSTRLSRKVLVTDALVAMDEYLDGVEIERLDLWGAQIKNADLDRLLSLKWFAGLRVLNLGANHLTKRGIDALAAHDVATQLRELTLSYNKLGNALAKISLPALEVLDVVFCGINDKALVKLGGAKLPKLERLMLECAALHIRVEKLSQATHRSDPTPEPVYSAEALQGFATTPLAAQLKTLALGGLTIDEAHAKAIGDHFDDLTELDLSGARMTAASVTALVSGAGLKSLEKLALSRAFAPNYSPGGELQLPSKQTADALAAIGRSNFAATLSCLVLNQVAIGEGLDGLLAHELGALTRLELPACQLDDAAMIALAQSDVCVQVLILSGNTIGPAGLDALVDGKRSQHIRSLVLANNPLGDDAVARLMATERMPALRRLSLDGTNLTDAATSALATSRVLPELEILLLANNRFSDDFATAIAAIDMANLQRLSLANNCLTEAGVASLGGAFPDAALFLAKQDPTKLPPRVIGNDVMRFREVAGLTKPTPAAISPALREAYPYPAWLERDLDNADWVFVMAKNDVDKYVVAAFHEPTERLVTCAPPITSGLPSVWVSADGSWLAVKAFSDGAYVVSLKDGAATRLGDVLTHQDGGVVFCDGRMVVLDCDTDGEWEGRLDVYGQDGEQWQLEHSIGGFYDARDHIVALARQRLCAIKGRQGLFFAAVRCDQFRFLGYLKGASVDAFDHDGRAIIQVQSRYSYELTNIDEVLDAAFAQGVSPDALELGEDAWQ